MSPIRLLAVSGSTRSESTNTALLETIRDIAGPLFDIRVYSDLAKLPVFSPDLEGEALPEVVRAFGQLIDDSDGLIFSSPEYVRAIPGGLKNAIDWLVSGDALSNKPICLAHASHRGDDMLASLRTVLATVSCRFNDEIFLRFSLMKKMPDDIRKMLLEPDNSRLVRDFLDSFGIFCASVR